MRAATRYIFSQVFILSEEPQCDGIFQQRNINSLSVLSVSALLARKTCKDVANGSFPFSLLLTSRVASEKSLSFGRKEERQEKKKEKETLLIEGFSINVSCRKGIIFSARKRPLHLFSAIFLGPPSRPLLPLPLPQYPFHPSCLPVRAGNLLERTDVFFRRFSCGTSSRGGSDCRRDLTRD